MSNLSAEYFKESPDEEPDEKRELLLKSSWIRAAVAALIACTVRPDVNVELPESSDSVSAQAAEAVTRLSIQRGPSYSCHDLRNAFRRLALAFVPEEDRKDLAASHGMNETLLADGVTRARLITLSEPNEDGTRNVIVRFRREDEEPVIEGEFIGDISMFCFDEIPAQDASAVVEQ